MSKDLYNICEEVCDEASFIVFLKALMKDRMEEVEIEQGNTPLPYIAGGKGWYNHTIESFLEAAISWAEDSQNDNSPFYKRPNNPWKRCADILYMGKVYE